MSAVLLEDLARVSAAVGGTRARSAKVELLADALRTATPAEVPVVVPYLSGGLRQRRTGLGYAALRDLPAPAQEPRITVLEADTVFGRIAELSGPGSQRERRRLLVEVMEEATAEEQQLLLGLVG
jgi:DNA ligase-1